MYNSVTQLFHLNYRLRKISFLFLFVQSQVRNQSNCQNTELIEHGTLLLFLMHFKQFKYSNTKGILDFCNITEIGTFSNTGNETNDATLESNSLYTPIESCHTSNIRYIISTSFEKNNIDIS